MRPSVIIEPGKFQSVLLDVKENVGYFSGFYMSVEQLQYGGLNEEARRAKCIEISLHFKWVLQSFRFSGAFSFCKIEF